MTPMVPRIMGWLLLTTTLSIPYMIYAPVVSAQTTEENSSESEAFQNFIAERNRQRIQVLNVAIQEDPENASLYESQNDLQGFSEVMELIESIELDN
jgi:hypothetical protein